MTNSCCRIVETIDVGFVLMGDVPRLTEDGTRCVLDSPDAFVQRGTAQRWIDYGHSPAPVGFMVVGTQATPRDRSRKELTCN
jgi:hypothetical protein